MTWYQAIYLSLIIIIPLIGYLCRSFMLRIDQMETEIQDKLSEIEIRTLLNDKLEPVKEDLKEIKEKVSKVIDYIIENK